jgi:hypothetical protein
LHSEVTGALRPGGVDEIQPKIMPALGCLFAARSSR